MVMSRRHMTRGITLVELLIAATVVGVIMMGVVSADYALRKQTQGSFTSAQSGLNAQVIVTHIINNAFLATGSNADQGIRIPATAAAADKSSFCIRTDDPAAPATPWVCYSILGATEHVYTCAKAAPTRCAAADTDLGQVSGPTDVTQAGAGVYTQFILDGAVGSQQLLFTVKVTVPDTSAPGGTRSVTASVSPPRHII